MFWFFLLRRKSDIIKKLFLYWSSVQIDDQLPIIIKLLILETWL